MRFITPTVHNGVQIECDNKKCGVKGNNFFSKVRDLKKRNCPNEKYETNSQQNSYLKSMVYGSGI